MPEAKPSGVYRPPGARLSTTNKRGPSQGPPEIFSDAQFPSLLATAKHVETRKYAKFIRLVVTWLDAWILLDNRTINIDFVFTCTQSTDHILCFRDREMEKTFEVVKHRNRAREETIGSSMQHLQLDNQYAILGDK